MDLDSAITLVLVALMIIAPALTAIMLIVTLKLKRRVQELSDQLNEVESHMDEALNKNESAVKDELAKQRRMLSESLSDINDSVTRGVVSMSRGKKQ